MTTDDHDAAKALPGLDPVRLVFVCIAVDGTTLGFGDTMQDALDEACEAHGLNEAELFKGYGHRVVAYVPREATAPSPLGNASIRRRIVAAWEQTSDRDLFDRAVAVILRDAAPAPMGEEAAVVASVKRAIEELNVLDDGGIPDLSLVADALRAALAALRTRAGA